MNPIDGRQTLATSSCSVTGVVKSTSCQFEWKIVKIYSLRNEIFFSEYFQFYNVSWRMQMYWCDNANARTKNISIDLQRSSCSTANPDVDTTIGFKRTDGSIFGAIRKVITISSVCYISKEDVYSIPFSEWKDIEVPNGRLTVVCILNSADTAVQETPRCDSILVKDFEDLFQSERDADVTIRVKEKNFKAHQSILVARSTVFATMFQHDMAERKKGEVDIDDCDPNSFRDFLIYLYTGKTDQVTSDNAGGLYITADKYLVEELKAKCSTLISHTLSIDSVFGVLVLATMHSDTKLLKSATDFFVKNVKQILRSPKWLEFQSKNLKFVHELFLKTADYVKV